MNRMPTRREYMLQLIERQTTAINTFAKQFTADPSNGGRGPVTSRYGEIITVDMMLDAILVMLHEFEETVYAGLDLDDWGLSEPLRIFHGTMRYGACDECGTQLEECVNEPGPCCPTCEREAQRMEDRRIH